MKVIIGPKMIEATINKLNEALAKKYKAQVFVLNPLRKCGMEDYGATANQKAAQAGGKKPSMMCMRAGLASAG